ncbi:RHS repeat domain-containing protein, partial [Chromobacterium alkanivorans]|uniref:RHS repeat domain-containing protein n=2 Tax=Chromobacterium alkanivorans TaxID=1071719 RepID=UPI003B8A752C
LGKVTQKTDAAGQVTDWRYDAQGRETRRQDAVFTDYLGRAVRPTSDSEYNGLDQLSRQIRHGLDEASEADDQIVRYQYGIGGRLLSQSDAMGNGIRYDYDAAGLLTRTQRARRQADGSEVNDVTGYRYDAAGRQTERRDQATSMRFETRYNAYGEIAGKRTSADGQGAWQEFADYDGAGRVFRRNEGGVTRAYLYDANGNATLQIESDSVDLRQMSRDQILAAINRPDSGLRLTVSEYDGRNQRVATYQPKMVNARDQALVQAERWVSAVPQEGSGGVVSAGASKIKENEQSSPLALGGVALGGGVVSGSVTLTPTAVLREDREELGSSRKFDVYLQEMNVNVNLPPLPEYGDDTYQVVITFPGRRVVSRTLTVPANGVLNTPVSMLYAQFVFAGSQNWPDSAVLGFEVAVYKTARNAATNTTQSLMLFQSSGQFSGAAIRNHTSSSYNGVFGANQLHFRSPDSRIAKVLLLTRPANSGEGWRRDEMPLLTLNGQVQSSWFALDWGGLPRGNLEYRLLALDAAGTVLFGQQNPSGAFLALSGSKPVFPQPASALPLGQYGSAVLGKDGAVNLYGLGSAVVRANIRFRLQGGSWGALQNIAATIGNGWFQFLPSNYGLAAGQTWEYELERLDAKGQSLGAVVGAFRPGEANSLSQPVAWRDQPQIVHIGGNQPAAASRGLIRYRKPGGAWAEAPLSRAANGEWDWDSSTLAKGLSAPTVYEFEYQLFDAKGLMLNRAGGQ